MTVGLPDDIASLNRQCGQAVLGLTEALDNVIALNVMLQNEQRGFAIVTNEDQSTTDPLTQGDGALTTQEAATLRSAFEALSLFAQVGYGQTAQSGAQPSNFFFDAQKLLGTNPL